MVIRRRSARLAGLLLLVPSLTVVGPVPAAPVSAAPAPAPATGTAVDEGPRASSTGSPSSSPVAVTAADDGIETDSRTRPVAPGLDLTSYDRFDANGWIRADALTADLTGGLSVDYVNSARWRRRNRCVRRSTGPVRWPRSTATSSTSTTRAPPRASAFRAAG